MSRPARAEMTPMAARAASWCRVAGLAALLAASAVQAAETGPDRAPPDLGRPAGAPAAAVPFATAARVAGDRTRTRFVLDLSGVVDIRAFALPDPYRVIIDLPEVHFRLSESAGRDGRGLITAYRYGLFGAGKSRIVLDVSDPVAIDKAFVLEAAENQPARLVVDLVKTDRDGFLRTAALDAAKRAKDSGARGAAPEAAAPANGAASPQKLVVLDPGHGGVDPGAMGLNGTVEKTVVFEFAKVLKQKLEADGHRVLMTREDDSFVPLNERVRFAREHQAALFVSIHADAVRAGDVRGATVYTVSDTASDDEAAATAHNENRADIIAGLDLHDQADDVTDILIDLAQRETRNFSISLARMLISDLKSSVRLVKRPHRFGAFRVLRAPDVPSVLVELGYLSNAQDEKLLTSPEWRERTAAACAQAVGQFLGRHQARSGL